MREPVREPVKLTERETICLEYLDTLMSAAAISIGRRVYERMNGRGGSNIIAIGATLMGRMRRRGLVVYLPDNFEWRISSAGRAALANRSPQS